MPKKFSRKKATGMSHNRSAHALAKVSNIPNVEDFVYETLSNHVSDTDSMDTN